MVDNILEEFTHYHRTCQGCGKNWWGLHCPHDGYQNACPECEAMPVVLNADYCDCEFVVNVSLVEQQVLIGRKAELRDAQNAWVKHGKIEQDVDYFVDRITELDHQIQLLKEGKSERDQTTRL
jgi:hypothetical protein